MDGWTEDYSVYQRFFRLAWGDSSCGETPRLDRVLQITETPRYTIGSPQYHLKHDLTALPVSEVLPAVVRLLAGDFRAGFLLLSFPPWRRVIAVL